MEKITSASRQTARFDFDLDDLLHPAQAFEHPRSVVEDPDLTLNEKRAILASWAGPLQSRNGRACPRRRWLSGVSTLSSWHREE